ncbi:MAG TPA: hypothetical protein DD640_07595 [Clostridiales bacterium]|nr:hypothetical protein [Clostridiales bacterium]
MNDDSGFQPIYPAQPPKPERPARPQIWKYVLTVLISVLITFTLTAGAGVLLFLGYSASQETGSDLGLPLDDDPETLAALAKLRAIYDQVDLNYFEDLTDAQMLEAMARGLVDELGNRYTMYLTAEENQQIAESMSGNYSGIGAIVAMNQDSFVEITEVIADSPAEEAGLQVGDLFTKVDGEDVTGFKDVSSVAALVRGEEGTPVGLVIYRPSTAKYVEFTVTRRKITNVSIAYRMLEDGLGYIMIRDFSSGVAANFIAAVQDLEAQGAKHLVFDVRNNTGGYADEVISMLDFLLPSATIATIKGRSDGKAYEKSWTSGASMGVSADMRYAILINGMSASASELFSGCLRDNGKAWLIGEQSFGKGSGTITIELSDGSAINLTNFLYYLPGGDCIEEIGLTPHEEVTLPEDAAGISISRLTLKQDTQLKAAIDYLKTID